ncbi:acid protease [Thozetella sp. PMI_491]|nr:acid protease [Thozetella sp. PMI_491]
MQFNTAVVVVLFTWLLESAWAGSSGPQALEIPASEYFEGNDGPWSSFHVRVGTPEQAVRVMVSTASPETLVVLSDLGCTSGAFGNGATPSNCAVSRGVLFNPNDSSTWHSAGKYAINGDGVGLEANLGYSQNAEFALETLAIGLTGPSLRNQTVAGIGTANPFYLGIFGLNNQPVNFSSLGNYSATSFVTTLKDQKLIPSLSWSYTAGARYRLKQVYGQLIFSGYDRSRFNEDKTASFTMADDQTRDLVVSLQSIGYSGEQQATLLSNSIQAYVDSTDPNLWLPSEACDAFEKAFGLTLDKTTGLYLVNDTHHTSLVNTDAEVTFRLSDVKSNGGTVTITLPYDAFALTAQPPLVDNSSYYFPLKRAANSTQYTLGRTFLQEAYLSADYERKTFNISPCVWNEGAKEDIVTILSKDDPGSSGGGSDSSSSGSGGLSPGAIAGITVGCVLVAILIACLVLLLIRRRNLVVTYAARDPVPDEAVMTGPVFNSTSNHSPSFVPTGSSPATVGEAIAEERDSDDTGHAMHAKSQAQAAEDTQRVHELHGESTGFRHIHEAAGVFELPGSTVPAGMTHGQRHVPATVGEFPGQRGREQRATGHTPSPSVSTMDTTGRHGPVEDGMTDLVSPTTPVRRHSNSS